MAAVPTANTMRYPVLTKHDKLDFQAIGTISMQLYSNTKSVPSFRGNGILGHVFLVLGHIAYTIATNGTAFVPPVNPGNPPVPPADATTSQIAIATANYNAASSEWQIYTTTDAILTIQLLECVDEKYYASLIDRVQGVSHYSLFEILTHLRAKHGVLTDQQIIANRTALEAPWEPTITMDALWQHTRNIVALGAAGNDVIDDAALIAP